MQNSNPVAGAARKANVLEQLKKLLEEASGIDFAGADPSTTFLELGLDSLFLTQVAMSLKRQFGVSIGFRQLLEDMATLDCLADHIVSTLPPEPISARQRRRRRSPPLHR